MRILLTNNRLVERGGTEMIVSELARKLRDRGHEPFLFSPHLGEVAQELQTDRFEVFSDLNDLRQPPDLIHGHHHLETMISLARFPGVPALYVCHGVVPFEESPPSHPRIVQYLAVDEACRDRIVEELGIDREEIPLVLNWVDLSRFRSRPRLPKRPTRALLFNSDINEGNGLPAVQEACDRLGMQLENYSLGSGRMTDHPEELLQGFDVVFAKGRSALEAVSVGATTILVGPHRSGPRVTPQNVEGLRILNLGLRALNRNISATGLLDELQGYDPEEAARASESLRKVVDISNAIDRYEQIYNEVLTQARSRPTPPVEAESIAVSKYLQFLKNRLREAHQVPHLKIRNERLEHELEKFQYANYRTHLARLEGELLEQRERLNRIESTVTWRLRNRIAGTFLHRAYRSILGKPQA